MSDILLPGTGILFMKVGTHAQETLEDIIVQIPTEGGHLFRFERGQGSDLKPATIPI